MHGLSLLTRAVVWLPLVVISVWVGTRESQSRPIRPTAAKVSTADIIYRRDGGERLRLDVYQPDNNRTSKDAGGLRPAVLLVHGGSWIGGSRFGFRRDPWRNATRLVEHGYVVVAADYRLARPESPSWPTAIEDLREAVRWIRRNAATYRVDPDRIALLGQSAGAHLAMRLATEPESAWSSDSSASVSSAVNAVVGFYGPYDLQALRLARSSRSEPVQTFLGKLPAKVSQDLEDIASPLHRVRASTPPVLLFHGTDDSWVHPEQSRQMATELERHGVVHRLIIVEGSRHGFETIVGSPTKQDLLPEILSFFNMIWRDSIR